MLASLLDVLWRVLILPGPDSTSFQFRFILLDKPHYRLSLAQHSLTVQNHGLKHQSFISVFKISLFILMVKIEVVSRTLYKPTWLYTNNLKIFPQNNKSLLNVDRWQCCVEKNYLSIYPLAKLFPCCSGPIFHGLPCGFWRAFISWVGLKL